MSLWPTYLLTIMLAMTGVAALLGAKSLLWFGVQLVTSCTVGYLTWRAAQWWVQTRTEM